MDHHFWTTTNAHGPVGIGARRLGPRRGAVNIHFAGIASDGYLDLERLAPAYDALDFAALLSVDAPGSDWLPVRYRRAELAALKRGCAVFEVLPAVLSELDIVPTRLTITGHSMGVAEVACALPIAGAHLKKCLALARIDVLFFAPPLGPLPYELFTSRGNRFARLIGHLAARIRVLRAWFARRISTTASGSTIARRYFRTEEATATVPGFVAANRALARAPRPLIDHVHQLVRDRVIASLTWIIPGADAWFPARRSEELVRRALDPDLRGRIELLRLPAAGHAVFDDAPVQARELVRRMATQEGRS